MTGAAALYPYIEASGRHHTMALSPEATEFLAMTDADDVAAFFGTTYPELSRRIYRWRDEVKYHQFKIRKKSGGGERQIVAPRKWLKEYQRRIAAVLLELYRIRAPVHGFVRNRSIVTNALAHVNKRVVLNLDLEAFFETVNFGRVQGLFRSKFFNLPHPVATILAQVCCFQRKLPQGAPTSPIITNYIAADLDRKLARLARANRCTYTRYADDLTFSFTRKMESLPPSIALVDDSGISPGNELVDAIARSGFRINASKTRLRTKHQRQEATGLTVNEFANVPRSKIRQTRAMIHAWKKFGTTSAEAEYQKKYATKHRGSARPAGFVHVIRGNINFIRSVRGSQDEIFAKLAKQFNAVADVNGLSAISYVEPSKGDPFFTNAVVIVEASTDSKGELAQGTAFYLNGTGWVTCAHVVCTEDGNLHEEIVVYWSDDISTKYTATVTHFDNGRDIALFKVVDDSGNDVPPKVELEGSRNARIGREVIVSGFPDYTPGQPPFVADTKIATIYKRGGVEVLEVSLHLSAGISGSPVLNTKRQVIGMVTKGARLGMGANLALTLNELLRT